jgi:hypothetical protein
VARRHLGAQKARAGANALPPFPPTCSKAGIFPRGVASSVRTAVLPTRRYRPGRPRTGRLFLRARGEPGAHRRCRAPQRRSDDQQLASFVSRKMGANAPMRTPRRTLASEFVRMATAVAESYRPLPRRLPPPQRPSRRNDRGRTFCARYAHGSSGVSAQPISPAPWCRAERASARG